MTAPIDPEATAVIADDEPLLRERLASQLARLWPGLRIVGQAGNGRETVELAEHLAPQVMFIDVHMPGLNGVEAARRIGRGPHIVFVTAYEQYALAAFERGAVDYLVKPVDPARLADTVQRLRERLAGRPKDPEPALSQALAALAEHLRRHPAAVPPPHLQWIRASVGSTLRMIAVDDVAYLKSDEKYTLVVWREGEALIRKTIRELVDELDPRHFVQIHRSTIVNLREVVQVVRGANETAELHLRGRAETLPVSRSYLHLFRQM